MPWLLPRIRLGLVRIDQHLPHEIGQRTQHQPDPQSDTQRCQNRSPINHNESKERNHERSTKGPEEPLRHGPYVATLPGKKRAKGHDHQERKDKGREGEKEKNILDDFG